MSGPFGNYTGKSVGAILNAMHRNERIPLRICETVTISNQEIKLNDIPFGKYIWLSNTDIPIFEWVNVIYNQHSKVITNNGLKPLFRVQLYNTNPALVIRGKNFVTQELFEFINTETTLNHKTYIDSKPYLLKYSLHDSMIILFNNPEKSQEFIEYINNNFLYSFKDDNLTMEILENITKSLNEN